MNCLMTRLRASMSRMVTICHPYLGLFWRGPVARWTMIRGRHALTVPVIRTRTRGLMLGKARRWLALKATNPKKTPKSAPERPAYSRLGGGQVTHPRDRRATAI